MDRKALVPGKRLRKSVFLLLDLDLGNYLWLRRALRAPPIPIKRVSPALELVAAALLR